MIAIGTEHGLTLLEFADRPMMKTQRERVRTLFGSEIVEQPFACLDAVRAQLGEYFAGARTQFDLPLLPLGTPFQRLVWRALLAIPSGHITSYEALATTVGRADGGGQDGLVHRISLGGRFGVLGCGDGLRDR